MSCSSYFDMNRKSNQSMGMAAIWTRSYCKLQQQKTFTGNLGTGYEGYLQRLKQQAHIRFNPAGCKIKNPCK